MNQISGDISALIEEPSNLTLGVLFGLVAAAIGAAAWAAITVLTGFQNGLMAIGVGFLVGIAVRQFGKGSTPIFGVVGALLAFGGCLAGNVLAEVGFASRELSDTFFATLSQADLSRVASILIQDAKPIDYLFYAVAIYEGFTLATVRKAAPSASPAA